jgi:uncharacterized membrane protein
MTSTRILTVAAVLSVVLNLLLVGFIVGQRLPEWAGPFARDHHEINREHPRVARAGEMGRARGMPIGPNDLNFFAGLRALDLETRKTVQVAFARHMPEIRADVENMMSRRRAVLDVLSNEPADMDRLADALSALREASAAAQEHSHKIFLEIAATLPSDKRADFMKAAGSPRGAGRERK